MPDRPPHLDKAQVEGLREHPTARTREGMAIAKAKGRLRGKQAKLKRTREAQLVALWRAGSHTTLELAEMFDVARSTVYRAIQRAGAAPATAAAPAAAPATAG